MANGKIYSPCWHNAISGYFYRLAASGMLPASWFRAAIPSHNDCPPESGVPKLEIVTHCWQYAPMLAHQLSSFVNYPPTKVDVVITVFYSKADSATAALLAFIEQHHVPHVRWNWQPLPTHQLFRRGIGRNKAARSTQADWIWMTDCDIVFHKGCLDSLATQLEGRNDSLLFPRQERTTPMLPKTAPLFQKGMKQLVDIDTNEFEIHSRDRAKGAFQIIHGDVARTIGYCDRLSLYQTPAKHWCKCYEDRAFRWLVGTPGTPVDIEGVYQIRHLEKGRYQKGSVWARIRSKIRRIQE